MCLVPHQDRAEFSRTTRSAKLLRQRRQTAAFTLVEVMMGVGIMGIMFVSLYAGLSYGYSATALTRQDERATQILEERMEVVRLLSWNQVTNPGYIPATFTDSYYSSNPTNAPSGSLIYTGAVTVTSAPITETYANDLRMIQITLSWQSGSLTHRRQMTTFVSQYGLQKYIY